MQIVIPLVMTFGIFGGDSMILQNTSGTLIGKIPAGSETWIQNAGYVWLVLLIPLAFAGWFGMNNLRTEHVSPHIGSPIGAFGKIAGMLLIGFITAAVGLYIILPGTDRTGCPRLGQVAGHHRDPVCHGHAAEADPR